MGFLTIPPAAAMIVLLATIYGALFHLWKGKTWSDLGRSIIAAILGFTVGQILALLFHLTIMRLGQVHLIEGSLFAWLFMFAIAWLRR